MRARWRWYRAELSPADCIRPREAASPRSWQTGQVGHMDWPHANNLAHNIKRLSTTAVQYLCKVERTYTHSCVTVKSEQCLILTCRCKAVCVHAHTSVLGGGSGRRRYYNWCVTLLDSSLVALRKKSCASECCAGANKGYFHGNCGSGSTHTWHCSAVVTSTRR